MNTLANEVGEIANNIREFTATNGWNIDSFLADIEAEVKATAALDWTRERRYITARIITAAPVCKTTPQQLCERIVQNIHDTEEAVKLIQE